MLYDIMNLEKWQNLVLAVGILAAFFGTFILTAKLMDRLPKDAGRAFAHDGAKSAGKPRGAGIIFVCVFCVVSLLFVPFCLEYLIYILLVFTAMMTGFLDDAAKSPWGEYRKGFLDLIVSILTALCYVYYNGSDIVFGKNGNAVHLPLAVFLILATILIWASINVTNCADGVDGLSGTLTIVTLFGILGIMRATGRGTEFAGQIAVMIFCILAYLWFNATPSLLMMGDAGSRSMGIFIAIAILQTGSPLLYIPLALVLILDGGLGLLKVALIRFLKIHILKNVRTPLHDQVRKVMGWSNTQCVYRFAIIQAVLCAVTVFLVTGGLL